MTFITSTDSWCRLTPTVTLEEASNALESGTFPICKRLYVVIHAKTRAAASHSWQLQVGTGGTYSTASIYTRSRQRGGETSDATGTGAGWDLQEGQKDEYWIEGWITNPATTDVNGGGNSLGTTLAQFRNMEMDAGSADASNTGDWTCKWDSDDQINCIRLLDSNTDTGIDTGSTITVYGSVTEVLSYTYPNLPNGAIFEDTTDGNHYMWNGTDTWNEVT